MKTVSFFLALLLLSGSQSVFAQFSINKEGVSASGSVIGDDVLYSIGGGRAVSMGSAGQMQSIEVGLGWNSNLICGDMNINTTVQNQLNGITNGFKSMMSQVIQNATSAVASLPALIIQRADPALYNLLTNGILQARLDFDRSKLSCQAMAERMADRAGGQLGWGQLADGMALKQSLARSGDAVAAIEQSESRRGNDGVTWVGGRNAGGAGQQPIKIIGDVTAAGYNLLTTGRSGSSLRFSHSTTTNSCGNHLACQTWPTAKSAQAWATRVLGEKEQRTCDNCTKTKTTPGVGLSPLIQEEYEIKLQALQDLISGNKTTTLANLEAASSSSLPITRGLIEALRDEQDQDVLGKRLASEVALSSVLEKALLLQRTLLTGMKEPNIASNQLALEAVNAENKTLEQEINNLKLELELRRELAGNAAATIIQRQRLRAEGSQRTYQGDTTRDRLQQIQQSSESRSK